MPDATLNIAGHGMSAAEAQYEALVNNLVNAHSKGYKAVGAVIKSFPEYLAEIENSQAQFNDIAAVTKGPMYPKVISAYSDFSQGPTIITNRNLDFAIEGEGFFSVQTTTGPAYTRDGRFVLNAEGILVTSVGGYPVIGEKGPIMVPPGAKFEILPNGETTADGNTIDQINISAFENPRELEVAGGNFFREPVDKDLPLKKEPRYQLKQGSVEVSNVSVVDEMMKMIMIQRAHESNVNVAKARDTLLQSAVQMGAAVK